MVASGDEKLSTDDVSTDGSTILGTSTKTGASILKTSPSSTPRFAQLYPERRLSVNSSSPVSASNEKTYYHKLMSAMLRRDFEIIKCENAVIKHFENSPFIKTMVGALEAKGCPLNLKRHIQCEFCMFGKDARVNHGGYDSDTNQIFICANNCNSEGKIHGLLSRQLIHLFDRCAHRDTISYRNLDHLACTEIRKANLGHCQFLAYFFSPYGPIFDVNSAHANCVRELALDSLVVSKFVDNREVAKQAINRVFDKCYADLEPYGRRCNHSRAFARVFDERYLMGYR